MKSTSQNGSTLIVSIIFMLIITTAVGIASLYTMQMTKTAQMDRVRMQAIAVGNAYIEYAFSKTRDAARTAGLTPMTSSTLSSITTTAANAFLTGSTGLSGSMQNFANYTVTPNYNLFGGNGTQFVYPATPELNPITSGSSASSKANGVTDASYPYYYYYLASVTVTASTNTVTPVTVHVTRAFQQEIGNPFAYAIFYNDLLEFHPGAATTVNGAVHSNGSSYLGASGGSLAFQGQVTYSGSGAYVQFYDGAHSGDTISTPTYSSGSPSYVASQDPMGISSNLFTQYAGNPNAADDYHEIIEPPVSGTFDPLQSSTPGSPSARLYDDADVIILISNSSSGNTQIQLLDSNDNVVTANSSSSVDQAIWNLFGTSTSTGTGALSTGGIATGTTIVSNTSYTTGTTITSSTSTKNGRTTVTTSTSTYVSGTTITTSTNYTTSTATLIQDAREGATVNLTALNVSSITGSAANTINSSGSGIVVYIADTRATNNSTTASGSQVRDGILLASGSTLLPGTTGTAGLTVVSENPVYIAGNYNTGSIDQPSAVISDAVNILSTQAPTKSGTGSGSLYAYSTGSLSNRSAGSGTTTVNTAILTGNVPSVQNGSYSGGVENFPRFLENWSNATFAYKGSMVEMFQSMQAVGKWPGTGTVYNAPTRNWSFDTQFLTKPPPGTFFIQQFTKQRWIIQ